MSGRRSPPTQRTGHLLGANSITMVMEMDLTVVINYSNCTMLSFNCFYSVDWACP